MADERPNQEKHKFEGEFQEFLQCHNEGAMPSQAVKKKIQSELVASKPALILAYIILSAMGYFISLSLCAQHNLGLFLLSYKIAHLISDLPYYLCAVVCGAIYTGIPCLLVHAAFTRFQQRFLLVNFLSLSLAVPLGATCVLLGIKFLSPAGHLHENAAFSMQHFAFAARSHDWIFLWSAAAILFPILLEFLIYRLFLRRKSSAQ